MNYEKEDRVVVKKLISWLVENNYQSGTYVIDGREHPYLVGLMTNYGPNWEGTGIIKWRAVRVDQLVNIWVKW